MFHAFPLVAIAASLAAVPAWAQHHHSMPEPAPASEHPRGQSSSPAGQSTATAPGDSPKTGTPPAAHTGMDHNAMQHDMHGNAMQHDVNGGMGAMRMGDARAAFGSGTALMPLVGGRMSGAMWHGEGWALMAHGFAWGVATEQSGPRGNEMAFVATMGMLTYDRELSPEAHLQLRGMLSVDPLMGRRGYPNLLATGETAFGRPLVDRQHPHDLFMELSARVDLEVGEDTRVFVYGGPAAEPALGPAAFMHRASARYLPLAPITHHWFDSTHITYGVVTAGVRTRGVQLEASAFRGREPDEARWNLETPALDSWSVRASWTPSPNWSAQVSHGRLKEPEAQHRGEDEARTTASVHYGSDAVQATVAWSAKNRVPGPVLTAWLAEANWAVGGSRHNLFGRVENVANDELFPDHDDPLHDRRFRVTRGELGYAYRLPLGSSVNLALGGSVLATAVPPAIESRYGNANGYTLFARLSLGQ
jgi:hypothetical protein